MLVSLFGQGFVSLPTTRCSRILQGSRRDVQGGVGGDRRQLHGQARHDVRPDDWVQRRHLRVQPSRPAMSLPRNALAVATASQSALGVCVCVLCVGFECWMHRDRTAPASPVDLELVACAAGASGDKCDESKWPDKDHGLVCGDCKARGGGEALYCGGVLCFSSVIPNQNRPVVAAFAGPGQPLQLLLQDLQWFAFPCLLPSLSSFCAT